MAVRCSTHWRRSCKDLTVTPLFETFCTEYRVRLKRSVRNHWITLFNSNIVIRERKKKENSVSQPQQMNNCRRMNGQPYHSWALMTATWFVSQMFYISLCLEAYRLSLNKKWKVFYNPECRNYFSRFTATSGSSFQLNRGYRCSDLIPLAWSTCGGSLRGTNDVSLNVENVLQLSEVGYL